jgi:small subunit ribosomal protein S20
MKKSIKELKDFKSKADAGSKLNDVFSIIDKASKQKVIHRNKASNMKSGLTKYVNALSD